MYKKAIIHLLNILDPETAHSIMLKVLSIGGLTVITKILKKRYTIENPKLKISLAGITFKNPVGLAAGFDKNAACPKVLSSFGFGHIEVGTITPLPQKGRNKPRIFRLSQEKALINRLGFPNKGMVNILPNLSKERKRKYVLGVNIGPNTKAVEEQTAEKDYIACMNTLKNLGDYFTINISSPNTKGLRALAAKKSLNLLLKKIVQEKKNKKIKLPIFLKISPDLTVKQLDDVLELIKKYQLDGIIATNTTLERPKNLRSKNKNEAGGLSGEPLKNKSTKIIEYAYNKTGGNLPIIGVGGVFSAKDAIEKIRAGASLIQIYTGFVYEGPSLAKNINLGILKYMKSNNLQSLKEIVGIAA